MNPLCTSRRVSAPRLRRAPLVFLAALLTLSTLSPSEVNAQNARRPVRAGEVKGVELQLEGGLRVVRGESLRWLFSAYEVVGLDGLRPARGARIRISTSLTPGAPLEVEADANGRAVVSLPVPLDAPGSFGVSAEVHASRGVLRRFDFAVQTIEARSLVLYSQPTASPRTTASAFGRLARTADGIGLPNQSVRVSIRDDRGPLGAPTHVQTDARGVFLVTRELPANVVGTVVFSARSAADDDQRRVEASASTRVVTPNSSALQVRVAPRRHLVAPGSMAEFDVRVRRADGRPVADAIVRPSPRGGPVFRIEDVPAAERPSVAITDARGRATVRVLMPNLRQGFRDSVVNVQAAFEGIGAAVGQATVRVASDRHASALTVEGGALSRELGGRVYVRVATMDGQPAGEVPVTIEGPRMAQVSAQTDGSGVAVLGVALSEAEDTRCGGASAASVTVRAGSVSQQFCLPVEDDAAARPRVLATATPGSELRVVVERTRQAARMPVAVTLFDADAARIVGYGEVSRGEDEVSITLPEGFVGDVLVRARPMVGNARQEARGSYTAVRVQASAGYAMLVRPRTGNDALQTEVILPSADHSLVALALPTADARGLARTLESMSRQPLSDAAIAALLAERVPVDVAASVILRDGELVPAPAPTNPLQLGLMRDPWRARARFVEGRLGLLFHAIEAHIDSNVPENIDEIASRDSRGRFSLNRQLLQSLPQGSLGAEGATGLGGEPLTIEELERLDRSFDFDAVAARITRQRLFTLMLALREFVRARGFDLPWARAGDPSLWLTQLRMQGSIQARNLVDGWGRPFELRAVARARFNRLQPVEGYEISSAGPDGRIGNRDDLFDPTARVLPTTSLYAEAVGEDALVARLQGVELGRTTVRAGSGFFGYNPNAFAFPAEGSQGQAQLGALPPKMVIDPFALALERPTLNSTASVVLTDASGATQLSLPVDDEPRTWGVLAFAVDAYGRYASSVGSARGGSSILTTVDLPRRLRVNEPLAIPLHLTNVTDDAKAFTMQTQSDRITIDVPNSVDVPAGETRRVLATLSGTRPGRDRVVVIIEGPGGARRELRQAVRIDRGQHPIRRTASGLAPFRTHLGVPSTAVGATTRLVVLTPRGLSDDPDLADVRRQDPALIAWSRALAGRPLGDSLQADLLRAQTPSGLVEGQVPQLSSAAAIVALSTVFDGGRPDAAAQAARLRAVQGVLGAGAMPDPNPQAGTVRMHSAIIAALATAGLGELHHSRPMPYWGIEGDMRMPRPRPTPLDGLAAWLPQLRATLRDFPEEPTLLARASAALLLADPRDGHARAMYTRARESAREVDDGLRVTSGETRPGSLEELAATLAMAVAAQQLGEVDDARAFVRAASRHAPALARAGGEPTFWWLAAGAYGAMGEAPAQASVQVNGSPRSVELASGRALVALELAAGAAVDVRSEEEAVFVRVESVFARQFEDSEGLFTLALAGEPGRSDGLAGYELTVTAQTAVGAPVLDVQLPAGVLADDAFLRAMESSPWVASASAREPGFVQLRLVTLGEGVEAPIALPLRWQSASPVRGLGVVAYAAGNPAAMTILPPSVLRPE